MSIEFDYNEENILRDLDMQMFNLNPENRKRLELRISELTKQRDQWREDAERLAKVLKRWTCSGLCTDPLCVMTKDTLAAHERLVKGEKK